MSQTLTNFKEAIQALTDTDYDVICSDVVGFMGQAFASRLASLANRRKCDDCGQLVPDDEFNENIEAARQYTRDVCNACV